MDNIKKCKCGEKERKMADGRSNFIRNTCRRCYQREYNRIKYAQNRTSKSEYRKRPFMYVENRTKPKPVAAPADIGRVSFMEQSFWFECGTIAASESAQAPQDPDTAPDGDSRRRHRGA